MNLTTNADLAKKADHAARAAESVLQMNNAGGYIETSGYTEAGVWATLAVAYATMALDYQRQPEMPIAS